MRRKRAAILKGQWYEEDPELLSRALDDWMGAPAPAQGEAPSMLLVPHAGHAYSGTTAGAGFGRLRGHAIERVILLSPSHRTPLRGVGVADPELQLMETPLGDLGVDAEAGAALLGSGAPFERAGEAIETEHGIEVQLPFLARALPDARVCPLVCGGLDETQAQLAGERIGALMDERTILVVSGDLTHYGRDYKFAPRGAAREEVEPFVHRLDHRSLDHLLRIDPRGWLLNAREKRWNACAVLPVAVALWALSPGARGEICAYSTSASADSWNGRCVSYAAVLLRDERPRVGAGLRAELLEIARRAVLEGSGGTPRDEERECSPICRRMERGVFVTLRLAGELRGCIGFPRAEGSIGVAVGRAAAMAASEDHRFAPLRAEELERVSISLSVLSPMRTVQSVEEIQIGLHGLYIKWRGRSGLLLPQVAEEFELDADQFVVQTLRKGRIPEPLPRDAQVMVFAATVFSE